MVKKEIPPVGIVESDPESMKVLCMTVEMAGFTPVTETLMEVKENTQSFADFIKTYHPRLVLFDIPVPYSSNALLVKTLQEKYPEVRSTLLILTTTNPEIVKKIFAPERIEVMGKPFDVENTIHIIQEKYNSYPLPSTQTNCNNINHTSATL